MKPEEVTTFNSADVMRGYAIEGQLGVCNSIPGIALSEPDLVFKEVLRLDKDGMTYKGVRIEDAGAAHRAWMETLGICKTPHLEQLQHKLDYIKACVEAWRNAGAPHSVAILRTVQEIKDLLP